MRRPGFLAAVLAVAASASLGSCNRPPASGEDAIAESIEKMRGKYAKSNSGTIVEVSFEGVPIKASELAILKGLSGLRTLGLTGTTAGEAAVPEIAGLKSLSALYINRCRFRGDRLTVLSSLPNLRILVLSETDVDDEALTAFDNGFESLEELGLAETRVTGKGLDHLKHLRGLRSLTLLADEIRNEDVERLVPLENLRMLSLGSTKLDDRAIGSLKKMSSLTVLDLSRTGVSRSGVSELETANPKCTISRAEEE